MKLMKNRTAFWLLVAGFQVILGLAVFAVTRAIYAPDQVAQTSPMEPLDGGTEGSERADAQELLRTADRLFGEKNYEQAASLYAKALEEAPWEVLAYNNLGLTLHYTGRSREAIRILKQGTVVGDGYARVWLTLGFVQSRADQVDEAKTALKRAVELEPTTAIGAEANRILATLP